MKSENLNKSEILNPKPENLDFSYLMFRFCFVFRVSIFEFKTKMNGECHARH